MIRCDLFAAGMPVMLGDNAFVFASFVQYPVQDIERLEEPGVLMPVSSLSAIQAREQVLLDSEGVAQMSRK